MSNFAEYGFGLVLAGDELENFLHKMENKKGYPLDCDPDTFAVEHGDHYDARFYGDDTEGRLFKSYNSSSILEDEDMLVFRAENQPDAFRPAYDSVSGVEKEFRSKIGEFLPDDFDYKAHIGYFECVVYSCS